MSSFIQRGESGNYVLVTSLVKRYEQFNVGRIPLKEVTEYGSTSVRTASSILHDPERDSVTVEQANDILSAVIKGNYKKKYLKKLETGVNQTLTKTFINDSGPKEHAKISGICKYITCSNRDFPTDDLIEVWKVRALLDRFIKSHNARIISLNPQCGLKTGTIEFILEKDFLTYVNMDLVVHISRRLLGLSTSPTFYESNTRQCSH